MKALKIDVSSKKVEEIQVGDSLSDIYEKIGNGCELFCVPYQFENGDALYADDESLIRGGDLPGCFVIEGQLIVGNAIILGTNNEGESADARSNADEINVVFVDQQYFKGLTF